MNQLSSDTINKQVGNSEVSPLDLLRKWCDKQISGCLQLSHNSITYFIYLYRGKIAYATNSLEPFERLERHLRRLSHKIPILTSEFRNSIRLLFESQSEEVSQKPSDYEAIYWLKEQNHLTESQSSSLISRIVLEVFETYLLLPNNCQNDFLKDAQIINPIDTLELSIIQEKAQKNLKYWYSFLPHISSSYQRPYFFSKPGATTEQQKLGKILRGFNFRQLSAILNQDELAIVKKFFPLIKKKTIVIHEPQSPFDLLPHISPDTANIINPSGLSGKPLDKSGSNSQQGDINLNDIANNNIKQKQWKIVCIDDSPTILNEITRFLAGDEFSVFSHFSTTESPNENY